MINFAGDFEIICFMTLKKNLPLIVAAVVALCSSCLSNDNEIVTYEDAAVTSFRLGSVRCYRTVKAKSGEDSTYSFSYSATSTPVYIDQIGRRIYNADSLVVGTDLSRVLVTIGTKSNSVVRLKSLTGEGWELYSTSDSIDLSQPRVMRVTSSDGQYNCDYTVDIVAHREYADSFSWSRMPDDAAVATFVNMRSAQAGGALYLLGQTADGTVTLLSSADGGGTWTACAAPVADMTGATMAGVDGKLLVLVSGDIYATEDGELWEPAVTPDVALRTVIGGSRSELYAIGAEGRIMVSRDMGLTWIADDMESMEYVDNTPLLPATDVSVIVTPTRTNSDVSRVTVVANKEYTGADDKHTTAVVWNKVVDAMEPQAWTYTNVAWDNYEYTLPRMEGLSAVAYADGIMAIGGTPVNNGAAPYSRMYYSPDLGATWHTQQSMNVPVGFERMKAATIVTDGNGYIYLIGSNPQASRDRCMIWRGKQNKVMWQNPQKYFE